MPAQIAAILIHPRGAGWQQQPQVGEGNIYHAVGELHNANANFRLGQ